MCCGNSFCVVVHLLCCRSCVILVDSSGCSELTVRRDDVVEVG